MKQNLEYQKRWRHNNPKRVMLNAARVRANKKGLEFDITVDDLHFPEVCPYLKHPFDPRSHKWAYSLDRVDNSKGYVKGNIQVISILANRMKNTATKEELETFARSVLDIG